MESYNSYKRLIFKQQYQIYRVAARFDDASDDAFEKIRKMPKKLVESLRYVYNRAPRSFDRELSQDPMDQKDIEIRLRRMREGLAARRSPSPTAYERNVVLDRPLTRFSEPRPALP